MRVVISGGGIAGLAMAAELRQQGREPIVLERAGAYTDAGYGLGMWPLGTCVFYGLGVYDELVERSTVPETYEMADHRGALLQRVPLGAVAEHGDPIITVTHTDLIGALRSACGDDVDLRMGTTVTDVDDHGDAVEIGLSNGDTLGADLLVITEGIHSTTRNLVFGPVEVFDTHWAVWTWWAKPGHIPQTTMREYWGPGRFVGVYPCPTQTVVVAGFPSHTIDDLDAPTETIKAHIRDVNAELCATDEAFDAMIDDAESFYAWPMTDCRADHWSKGRVVLCGDAGTAFLPTAGAGATNALRAAAALGDELSRAGARTVPLALELYEKRARHVIEANQHDSRAMARYMFVENRAMSWARDQALRHYPPTKVVDQIVDSMHTPF